MGVMPYTFSIDLDSNVIREVWRGPLDLQQLMNSCHDQWVHPDYRKGLNILSDFRRARSRLTADDVLKFASWFSNDDAPPKHAIVVRRQLGLDHANIFTIIRESTNPQNNDTRIFFSVTQAESWLSARPYSPSLLSLEVHPEMQIAASDG
jgi:hypothetical protein